MKDNKSIDQLNNVYNTLFCEEKEQYFSKFYGGNYIENLRNAISKEAPSSQIAFIAKKQTYLKFIKPLTDAINSLSGKIAGLIIEDGFLSVDALSEIFNLPDDVRLAVTFDAELFESLAYYCNFKGIPLVLIPQNTITKGILSTQLYIKNGKKSDKIKISVKRYILLDFDLIKSGANTLASSYAEIMSNLAAFTDYRIYGAATGEKLNKAAYNLARSAVYDEFDIFSKKPEERAISTVKNGIFIEMAASLTDGKFIGSSVPQILSYFIKDKIYKNLAAIKLSAAFETFYLYNLLTEQGFFNVLPIINYNSRAEKVADFLDISEEVTVNNLLSQINSIKPNLKKAEEVFYKLKSETAALLKLKTGVLSAYSALGGEIVKEAFDKKEVFSKLKYAGDTPFGINGLSVLRDAGLLEYEI